MVGTSNESVPEMAIDHFPHWLMIICGNDALVLWIPRKKAKNPNHQLTIGWRPEYLFLDLDPVNEEDLFHNRTIGAPYSNFWRRTHYGVIPVIPIKMTPNAPANQRFIDEHPIFSHTFPIIISTSHIFPIIISIIHFPIPSVWLFKTSRNSTTIKRRFWRPSRVGVLCSGITRVTFKLWFVPQDGAPKIAFTWFISGWINYGLW